MNSDRRRSLLISVSLLLSVGSLLSAPALAHELRPAYLELTELENGRVQILWKQPLYGAIATRLRLTLPPAWKETEPTRVSRTADTLVQESVLDPGAPLQGQRIGIDGLAQGQSDALVRVRLRGGAVQTFLLRPGAPSVDIPVQTTPTSTAYLRLGIEHILLGPDHLLFVLGLLVLIGRRWRVMFETITAFTVAHSLTLAAATLGVVRVPSGPLNVAIALSIVFLGVEVVRKTRGESSFTIERPWVAAFLFGLVHGLGFAGGLATLGLAPGEVVPALLLFNVGVELGQLAFVALYLALRRACRTLEVPSPRWAEVLPGYVVGTLGAYWTIAQAAAWMGR